MKRGRRPPTAKERAGRKLGKLAKRAAIEAARRDEKLAEERERAEAQRIVATRSRVMRDLSSLPIVDARRQLLRALLVFFDLDPSAWNHAHRLGIVRGYDEQPREHHSAF